MKIKICGLTNLDDTLGAIEAGADILGFIFYPKSPRNISIVDCARIIEGIRAYRSDVTTVGVFVNETAGSVHEVLNLCGLDLAQLHGSERPEMLTMLWGRAYKAIRPRSLSQAERAAELYTPLAHDQPALLVDTPHEVLYGGTGHVGDWSIARRLAAQYAVLLAGGLTAYNVAAAVSQVAPWGVDVASGVESSPGRKDHTKMIDFVQAARESLAQLA